MFVKFCALYLFVRSLRAAQLTLDYAYRLDVPESLTVQWKQFVDMKSDKILRTDHFIEDLAALDLSRSSEEAVRFSFIRYIFARFFISLPNWAAGCDDADVLLPIFSSVWQGLNGEKKAQYAFLDGGANVGHTTSAFLSHFSPITLCNHLTGTEVCTAECRNRGVAKFYSFEPVPYLVRTIEARAAAERWADYGWQMVPKALTQDSGPVPMFFADESQPGLFEQGSLDYSAAQLSSDAVPTMVPGLSIDDFVFGPDSTMENRTFFLLKLDLEGYDYEGLLGARRTLGAKRVKFLVFEQNGKSATNGRTRTLKDVVDYLDGLDYFCFYIFRSYLTPITGRWWMDLFADFRVKSWSNIFCGLRHDSDVLRIFHWFTYSQNEFLKQTDQKLRTAGISRGLDEIFTLVREDLEL